MENDKQPEIDFGTRYCEICDDDIPAQIFGSHVFVDHLDEIQKWPGGVPKLLEAFQASLDQSIAAAEGYPKVQAGLRVSKDGIAKMQKSLGSRSN